MNPLRTVTAFAGMVATVATACLALLLAVPQ
jgi:hypothetical protein